MFLRCYRATLLLVLFLLLHMFIIGASVPDQESHGYRFVKYTWGLIISWFPWTTAT